MTDDFAGSISVYGARSHGGCDSSLTQKQREDQSATSHSTQVEDLAFLHPIWRGVWHARAFSRQVLGLISAAIFLALFNLPIFAADFNFTDITLRSGPQLKEQFSKLLADRDVAAAVQYFAEDKLTPDLNGFTEFQFRAIDTSEYYSLYFIPVSAAVSSKTGPNDNPKHLVLAAKGPKSKKVLLGTVSPKGKEAPPVVTQEKEVIDGNVQAEHGLLTKIFKCSATGCAGAAGCVYSGPYWIPCTCLSCGSVVAICSLTELFLP